MENLDKERLSILSRNSKNLFYTASFLILIGFFCVLTEAYLLVFLKNYVGNLNEIMFYLGSFCTLLGLILMHGLRGRLKRQKIMIFRKASFFSCLLGYLTILIWLSPFLFLLGAFLDLAFSGKPLFSFGDG